MQKVLAAAARNPNLIPSDFMAYIVDYIQTSRLSIPIGQVFGFTQFTAQAATTITTQQSTTSLSYVDLGTVGPELTALPDGQYLFLYGSKMGASTSSSSFMSISVNGSTPLDVDAASVASPAFAAASIATVKTLKNGGTSDVKAMYKGETGTSVSFNNRWLIALKFSNV